METTEERNDFEGFAAEQYGIMEKQASVAYAMVRGGKPIAEILTEFGVSEEEFTEWVRGGKFSEYASALASGFAQADAPYIWNSLTKSAKEGNMQAIKLYFDIWSKKQAARSKVNGISAPDGDIEALRADIFGEDD